MFQHWYWVTVNIKTTADSHFLLEQSLYLFLIKIYINEHFLVKPTEDYEQLTMPQFVFTIWEHQDAAINEPSRDYGTFRPP